MAKRVQAMETELRLYLIGLRTGPSKDVRDKDVWDPDVRPILAGTSYLLTGDQLVYELREQSPYTDATHTEVRFGPVYEVDPKTHLLIVWGRRNPYRLVWRDQVDQRDFFYRMLTDDEHVVVDEKNIAILDKMYKLFE